MVCGKRISADTSTEWDAKFQHHLNNDCIQGAYQESVTEPDED